MPEEIRHRQKHIYRQLTHDDDIDGRGRRHVRHALVPPAVRRRHRHQDQPRATGARQPLAGHRQAGPGPRRERRRAGAAPSPEQRRRLTAQVGDGAVKGEDAADGGLDNAGAGDGGQGGGGCN